MCRRRRRRSFDLSCFLSDREEEEDDSEGTSRWIRRANSTNSDHVTRLIFCFANIKNEFSLHIISYYHKLEDAVLFVLRDGGGRFLFGRQQRTVARWTAFGFLWNVHSAPCELHQYELSRWTMGGLDGSSPGPGVLGGQCLQAVPTTTDVANGDFLVGSCFFPTRLLSHHLHLHQTLPSVCGFEAYIVARMLLAYSSQYFGCNRHDRTSPSPWLTLV